MKRRYFSLFAAVLLLAVLLAGCHRDTPDTPEITESPTITPDPHAGEVEVLDPAGGTMWVPEAPNMPVFAYEAASFTVADQIPSYAGEGLTMRRGIDVSEHQKEIDWQAVAASGVEFAIIRCGYRSYSGEGNVHEDEYFRRNIQGALDAGLEVGVYFFSQAVNILEAAEEAVFVTHLIEDYDVTLPVFFDWERIGTTAARTDEVDGETLTDCLLEFSKLVQVAGYEPGMYCYLNLAYFTYQLKQMEGITFWMGDPGTMPIFYFDHDFWQYSFTGSVPGIEVDVDLDAMYVRQSVTAQPDESDEAVPVEADQEPEAAGSPDSEG